MDDSLPFILGAAAIKEIHISGKIQGSKYSSNIWNLGSLVEFLVNIWSWFSDASVAESPLNKSCGITPALVGV